MFNYNMFIELIGKEGRFLIRKDAIIAIAGLKDVAGYKINIQVTGKDYAQYFASKQEYEAAFKTLQRQLSTKVNL